MAFIGGEGVCRELGVELLKGDARVLSDHRANLAFGSQYLMPHQTIVAPDTHNTTTSQEIRKASKIGFLNWSATRHLSIAIGGRTRLLVAWGPLLSSHPMADRSTKSPPGRPARGEETRALRGLADEGHDGFIHCRQGTRSPGPWPNISPAARSRPSCRRPRAAGDAATLEPSRGGELFPHLYGPLDLEHVHSVGALTLQEDGSHRLPEGIAP